MSLNEMEFFKIHKINMAKWVVFSAIVITSIIFVSCRSSAPGLQISSSNNQPYYVSVTESEFLNNQIEEGFQSVRRIQNNIVYRSYIFSGDQEIREADLDGMDFEVQAIDSNVETITNAGTATVLYRGNGKAILLTAAHTVVRSDTLVHFSGNQNENENFVEAVSVLISTNRFVITDDGIVSMRVLKVDNNKDIALMVTQGQITSRDRLNVLDIPPGNFDEIEWGNKVVAMGYPKGVKMLTSGMVSLTEHPHRTIVVDLNINQGFSGGLIYAVNSTEATLEWIGMITSAMGERLTYLVPQSLRGAEYNPDIPYRGGIFVNSRSFINYGIGYGVDISEINRFIQETEQLLVNEGLNFSGVY